VSELARCLSRSCTTGWLDWVHGELWLLPTGLVRIRLSMAETKQHGLGPTVPPELPQTDPGRFDFAQVRAGHPTNKAIHFDAIARANLARGIGSHGLRLVLRDGAKHKLLWLARDPAYAVLAATLPDLLGDRLA
jgi:hypothetical protein